MKKSIREAGYLVLIATLVAISAWLYLNRQSFFAEHKALAEMLAKPSPQKPWQAPKFEGTPNTTVPPHAPLEEMPALPAQPTDDEIVASRILPNHLWAVDVPGAQGDKDNAELAKLLAGFKNKSKRELYAAIEQWLGGHRNSRWYHALNSQLADFKWSRGYFSEARQRWTETWTALKNREDINAYHLGNDVLGQLLETTVGMARVDVLRQLVDDAFHRPLNGALEGKLYRAREAVWLLDHTAAQNVMCGPLALNAIKDYHHEPYIAPRLSQVPPEFQSTGLALAEVQRFAQNDYKLPMKAAKRKDADQNIPTPAVMHVKDDHYCALLEQSKDGNEYFMEDRTLGVARWVDRAAVDAMSSGNFLLAANELPAGFASLSAEEVQGIYGRDGAHGTVNPDEEVGDEDPKCDDNQCKKGMPTWTFHPIPGAIRLGDIPVSYPPPLGPRVAFQINYNDADSGAPTSPPTWSHVGVTWSTNWVAWVEHVSGTLTNSSTLRVRVPGGGTQVTKYNTTTGQFGPHDQSFATIKRTGTYTYTREMPDGSKEVYNSPDNPTTPSRVYLTEIIDPQGNKLTLAYDSNIRLVSVTDAIGQVTTLAYTDAGNIYRITRVTDPFGRHADLAYDTAGRLTSITDQINLTTTFTYNASSGFIDTMVSPYGTSTFALPVNSTGSNRIVEATDPLGGKQRVEYNDTGSTFVPSLRSPPKSVTVGGQVISFYAEDSRLQFRNAWYWNKLQNEVAPGDYKAARNYRFYTNANWQVVPVIESVKEPQEDRVWYNYPGGVSFDGYGFPYYPGISAAPEKVLRMLPDGTPQLRQSYTDSKGNVIKTVDPLGRSTEFTYAANGIDMTEVRQTTNGINERLMTFTYNALHQPLTITDGSGSVTTYTYNASGKALTVTNALSQVTTFAYNANGFLTSIDGPLAGSTDSTTLTYDALGRIRTTTNPDGYTLTYSYDSFDRVTEILYPDATAERITYDKLDRSEFRDRSGHLTTFAHDSLQNLSKVTDPLGRISVVEWCKCGEPSLIKDPEGNVTRWKRDLQGRPTAKIFADNSSIVYTYDEVGRLSSRKDENGQTKVLRYTVDNQLSSLSFKDTLIPTPSVQLDYDPLYTRVIRMSDGAGETKYRYRPNSLLGAGQIEQIDGPLQNDEIAYSYDALGRVIGRTVAGKSTQRTLDSLGRTTDVTDFMGHFAIQHDGNSKRVVSVQRPNSVVSQYTYSSVLTDSRLLQAQHKNTAASVPFRSFGYEYDSSGRLLKWTQESSVRPPLQWSATYDDADQLIGVDARVSGALTDSYRFQYDQNGNRTQSSLNNSSETVSFNGLNEIRSRSAVRSPVQYSWDGDGRLVKVYDSNTHDEVTIKYDGLGRRVEVIHRKNLAVIDHSQFVWDGSEIVEQRSLVGSPKTNRFGMFGEQIETSAGSLENRFYTTDHLGSVRAVTNDAGVVVDQLDYSPWGGKSGASGNQDPSISFGKLWSQSGTDLLFGVFRQYDPSSGRWISRDPIGESAGLNLFAYCQNRPLDVIDPLGLNPGIAILGPIAGEASLGGPLTVAVVVGGTIVYIAVDSIVDATVDYMSQPGPGTGTCSRSEHALLQSAVNAAKLAVGALGKCNPSDCCAILKAKKAAWLSLAGARSRINVRCYGGGDAGHQQAAADAWQNVARCDQLILSNCK